MENTPGYYGQTILDAVGILPGVGILKYSDEAGLAVKNAVKNINDAFNCGSEIVEQSWKQGDNLINGMKLETNQALDAAEDFLGKGYKDLGNGRYMSADGKRVVRMGDSDILGQHGGGAHMNFETLAPNPNKPGKMMVTENLHIYLK